MSNNIKLMKGNEALAEAAVRCGVDAYFGYPITPQSEILEYLMENDPKDTTGMVVLQAESEVASINMVYSGAGCGKKVFTSSSSPGISLMAEGISYIAGAELPAVIVNVMRGGPGLGTIQPSQADYLQAVKGCGHGDYSLITLAPASVQEMADFVELSFELAFKYRTPALILSDGLIGQMMEKVELKDHTPRWTNQYIKDNYKWATTGKDADREKASITSLNLQPEDQEAHNIKLQAKYQEIKDNEVRVEMIDCEDADYVFIAFGSVARICQKAKQLGEEKGYKIGVVRPITVWPYPEKEVKELASKIKGFMCVEMNSGQMLQDVKLAVNGACPVEFHGRMGGMVPSPEEILEKFEEKFIK